MNFREIFPPPLPGMRCWRCVRGFWSFIIARDAGHAACICSYRDSRQPKTYPIQKTTARAVMFHGDREITREDAPEDFYYPTFTAAVEACRKKYKELLLR